MLLSRNGKFTIAVTFMAFPGIRPKCTNSWDLWFHHISIIFRLWVTVITIYHLASLLMPNRAKFLHIDNIYKRSSSVFHGRCIRTKIIIPAIGASNLVIGILLVFFPYNSIEFGNDAETRIILKYECTDAVSFGYIESSFWSVGRTLAL